jgi:hypothetical protein
MLFGAACAKKTAPVTTAPLPPSTSTLPPTAKAGPVSLYPPSATVTGEANPDITQANIQDNICNKNWTTKTIRPPSSYTTALKKKQMAAWKLSGTTADYEEDHLISLEIGGHPKSEANLWPELWTLTITGTDLGARAKDLVENYVHDEICFSVPNAKWSPTFKKYPPTVAVPLVAGQQILATDWYACYQKMLAKQPCQ